MVPVRIILAALTRVEFTATVMLPEDLAGNETFIDGLVDRFYDDIDGGDYYEDTDYWERGECFACVEEDGSAPTHAVTLGEDGDIDHISEIVGVKPVRPVDFIELDLTVPVEDDNEEGIGYSGKLGGDRQVSAEESIAAAILGHKDIEPCEVGENVAAQLGRSILYEVLREFRPDLFDDYLGGPIK